MQGSALLLTGCALLGGTAIVVPERTTPVGRSAAVEPQDGLRRVYGRG